MRKEMTVLSRQVVLKVGIDDVIWIIVMPGLFNMTSVIELMLFLWVFKGSFSCQSKSRLHVLLSLHVRGHNLGLDAPENTKT